MRTAPLLVLGVLGCGSAEPTDTAIAAPAPRTTSFTDAITPASLRKDVGALASDDMRGRGTPSPELDRAASYLAKRFAEIGLQPADAAGFEVRFPCAGPDSAPSANVLAILPGSDTTASKQTVIVSAHYDHLGSRGEGEDTIFNGANDDASGVAAMLGVATALAQREHAPRRTVMFAAFCGEERGLLGSSHYVEQPSRPLADTVAVVNLEMLGRADPQQPRRAWLTGMARSDLGDVFVTSGAAAGITFVDGSVVGPLEGRVFDASDNWPFAKRGIVAHSVSGGPIDPQYHTVDDEPDRLDYDAMAPIVAAIADATFVLADRVTVPVWREGGRPEPRAHDAIPGVSSTQ